MHTSEPLLQADLLSPDQASPDMLFAARLISQMQRELSQRKRHMLRVVNKWIIAYDYVKMLEEQHLHSADPLQVQTQFFRGTLAVVHGLGVIMLGQLENKDADRLDEFFGFTFADLTACVEELADLKRALDSDLTPEMIAAMNQQLFGSAHAR